MEEEEGRGDILCDRRQRLLTKGYGEGKAMRHLLGLKWKTSFSSRIRVRKLKSFVSSGLVERKGGGGFGRAGGEADYKLQRLQKEANEKALYGGDIIEGGR